jgi:DNA-binding transcriptional LysR family regulator
MDITDARTFIAVAEAGTISRAARELHLTQPAVTRRVQRLEQAIGAELIDRSKRPFALTDVGQAAVERCRKLVATRDELKALAQAGVLPTRELRIGVAHALTGFALTEPVDELRRVYPGVVLRLHTGWSRDLTARVSGGALDAAVVLHPRGESLPLSVQSVAVADEQLQVIAPRSWRANPPSLKDAAETGWILNPDGCAARGSLQKSLSRAGLPLRVSVETYDYELQMSLVARGRGLGLIPERLLVRSATRRQLCTLSIRSLNFPMKIWFVTGSVPAALEPPLAVLTQALRQRLASRR